MDFYKILLSIMDKKNLSIPDVSRATGITDSTIRSIISRKTKNISLEVAFKLSKGLNISLEELNGDLYKDTTDHLPEVTSRIKHLRIDILKLSQEEFAKKINLECSTLINIESGKATFFDEHISNIANIFSINEDWIYNGKGTMFNSSKYEKEFCNIINSLNPITQEYLLKMAKELLETQNKLFGN